MSLRAPQDSTTPGWTTLVMLAVAVLGLHLLLLLGNVPTLGTAAYGNAPTTSTTTTATELRSADTTSAAPPQAPPPRATVSTVRWIVATAPPPAEPQPAAKPVRKPQAQAKPAPPEPAPKRSDPVAPPQPSPDSPPDESPAQDATPIADSTHELRDAIEVALREATPDMPPPPETRDAGISAPLAAQTPQTPAPPSEAPTLAQPPGSSRLAYSVSGNVKGLNYSTSSTLNWTLADGQYSARMEVRIPLLGSRVQTSAGRVNGSGLLPDRFSDKSRSERAAHFDHAQQSIRFSNNRPDAALEPGAQDRLSLFMQLAGLLNARPAAYTAGQTIALQVAGTSDAEIWRFRVEEETMLELPAGALRARRLVREPRQPRDSLIDIWFAADLAYLPVRIRITQDSGDRIDQQLSQMP